MTDELEDEQLRKAIELSLREHQHPSSTSSQNDNELVFQRQIEQAIQESRKNSSAVAAHKEHQVFTAQHMGEQSQIVSTLATNATSSVIDASGSLQSQLSQPSSFLSERVKLEQERLARQKRLRPDVIQNHALEDDEEIDCPAKRQRVSSLCLDGGADLRSRSPAEETTGPSSKSFPAITTQVSNDHQNQSAVYWNGEIRQTACIMSESRRDGGQTFRLSEIIGNKSDISHAILCSYSLDLSWIYNFFHSSTPVVIVTQPGPAGASMRYAFPNWVLTTPSLGPSGRGCMHIKLIMLFYKSGRLRIAIPTANLVDTDWKYMENTVWLQDLPRCSSSNQKSLLQQNAKKDGNSEDFETMIREALTALNLPNAWEILRIDHSELPIFADIFSTYDFSRVKVALVASLAGRREGWPSVIRIGHTRLMKALITMNLSRDDVRLECQGSSIGQYSVQWLHEFLHSAKGLSAQTWLDTPKTRRAKLPIPTDIKVIFPSRNTVDESALGVQGGGTIFCSRRQWYAANFPRVLFHDSKSKGGPALMHSKMIIAIFKEKEKESIQVPEDDDSDIEIVEDNLPIGWAYIGSHNFTPSAWGNLSGSAFNPIMNNINFEMGVVFPLKDKDSLERIACFERPPRKYSHNDKPWIQEEIDY